MTNELKEYITARRKAVSCEIMNITAERKKLFDELNRAKDAINALNEREKPLADELEMLSKAINAETPAPVCTPPCEFLHADLSAAQAGQVYHDQM